MSSLALAQVSLRHADTGLSAVVFDVDPQSYDPFTAPVRGSSTPVLDGGTVHQVFGLQEMDFRIQVQGIITDYDTLTALWTLYRQSAGGLELEWRDWFPNKFRVIFVPGQDSFHPLPILGSCEAHNYSLSFTVIDILEWFGGMY